MERRLITHSWSFLAGRAVVGADMFNAMPHHVTTKLLSSLYRGKIKGSLDALSYMNGQPVVVGTAYYIRSTSLLIGRDVLLLPHVDGVVGLQHKTHPILLTGHSATSIRKSATQETEREAMAYAQRTLRTLQGAH